MTKPLSPKDEDDRMRMVFGLTSNDPLPEVDDETLETYHKHLSKNLAFPFEAEAHLGDRPVLQQNDSGEGDRSGRSR